MKATDLMIGDWVICNHYQDKSFTKQFGVADFAKGEYEFCEPIPLTKEIIEKNGWKIYVNGEYIEYYCSSEIPNLEYNHILKGYHYQYAGTKTNICIYYVHQLQHLLRLAGVQKEIEL